MNEHPMNIFTLNGSQYDSSQLPKEGQQLLSLINETQNQLNQLETKKILMQAAQQQLIEQLKPYLQRANAKNPVGQLGILGTASLEMPTTPTIKPIESPSPFPDNIPSEIRQSNNDNESY